MSRRSFEISVRAATFGPRPTSWGILVWAAASLPHSLLHAAESRKKYYTATVWRVSFSGNDWPCPIKTFPYLPHDLLQAVRFIAPVTLGPGSTHTWPSIWLPLVDGSRHPVRGAWCLVHRWLAAACSYLQGYNLILISSLTSTSRCTFMWSRPEFDWPEIPTSVSIWQGTLPKPLKQ